VRHGVAAVLCSTTYVLHVCMIDISFSTGSNSAQPGSFFGLLTYVQTATPTAVSDRRVMGSVGPRVFRSKRGTSRVARPSAFILPGGVGVAVAPTESCAHILHCGLCRLEINVSCRMC
jgi:hypothetical protein